MHIGHWKNVHLKVSHGGELETIFDKKKFFVSNHSLDLIDDIRERNFDLYNVIRKI